MALPLFYFLLFLLHSNPQVSESASSDVGILLQKIKPSLQGPSFNLLLSSWNSSVPVCQWRGLKWAFSNGSQLPCDDVSSPHWTDLSLFKSPLHLLSLQLPSANLSGSLPRELAELAMLRSLFLNINFLTGTIPLELGYSSSLSDVDLTGNMLNGTLPPSIWNICGVLSSLKLRSNMLTGSVPEPALPNTTCSLVEVIDIGDNQFSGEFPAFFAGFRRLRSLDVSSNMFTGVIPAGLAKLQLDKLNVSHNNFSGQIPSFDGSKVNWESFEGNNEGLCGFPLRSCGGNPRLSSKAIAVIVIALMAGGVVLASLLIGYMQNRKRKYLQDGEDEFEEDDEEEDSEGKLIVFQGGEHLSLDEVLNAAGQVIEKTSYGTVYKAKLSDGGAMTLRLIREGCCREKASCLSMVKLLGKIRHENLVQLRAFYQGKRGEKLLIYDHLPYKTLHEILHEGKAPMNWAKRHKLALGVARGLAHLHNGFESPIVHGNLGSKTVLVDENFVARVTEFGMENMVIDSVGDEMVAMAKAEGYKAPELQRMKKSNCRTDVYAYGILLLEILMGKKGGKSGGNGEFRDLPAMVKVAVLEEATMEVFDAEMMKGVRNAMEEGLVHVLKLAMGCCAPVASVRPSMEEVVKQLEENRPRNRSAIYSPAEVRSGTGTPL